MQIKFTLLINFLRSLWIHNNAHMAQNTSKNSSLKLACRGWRCRPLVERMVAWRAQAWV
jgi:hypothetical protein